MNIPAVIGMGKISMTSMTEKWVSLMDLQEQSMWIRMKRHCKDAGEKRERP